MINYITLLPTSEQFHLKFKYILVIVDQLTKMRYFIATKTLKAEELADRFIKQVYSLYGTPETIVSN